jgi:hypothetical protein
MEEGKERASDREVCYLSWNNCISLFTVSKVNKFYVLNYCIASHLRNGVYNAVHPHISSQDFQ